MAKDFLTYPTTISNINTVMNIDDLIQELINLKSQGVETIELLDENGYDYGIDSIQQSEDRELSVARDEEDPKVGYLAIYTK